MTRASAGGVTTVQPSESRPMESSCRDSSCSWVKASAPPAMLAVMPELFVRGLSDSMRRTPALSSPRDEVNTLPPVAQIGSRLTFPRPAKWGKADATTAEKRSVIGPPRKIDLRFTTAQRRTGKQRGFYWTPSVLTIAGVAYTRSYTEARWRCVKCTGTAWC